MVNIGEGVNISLKSNFISIELFCVLISQTMARQLTVLFVPMPAVGHVNSAIGLAQELYQSGHKIEFFISDLWKGRSSSNKFYS